jgi:hypothetical protein
MYTVGDRNSDDWPDLILVNQIATDITSQYDTVTIQIYDGPTFSWNNRINYLAPNYSYWEPFHSSSITEYPNKAILRNITRNNHQTPHLFLFFTHNQSGSGPSGFTISRGTGKCLIIDTEIYYTVFMDTTGSLLYCDSMSTNDSTYLITITATVSSRTDGQTYLATRFVRGISYYWSWSQPFWDLSIYFMNQYSWSGFTVADFNRDSRRLELSFTVKDSLYMKNILSQEEWAISELTGITGNPISMADPVVFSNPQVICKMTQPTPHYQCFNAINGTQTYPLADTTIFNIVQDINHDERDEFVSVRGNQIRVFNISPRIGIETNSEIPYSTYISLNYPNPFNSSTTIDYYLENSSTVSLDIYDILGRKVESLVNEWQPAGQCRVTWNASDKTSGVYFYRLKIGDQQITRKMILLR